MRTSPIGSRPALGGSSAVVAVETDTHALFDQLADDTIGILNDELGKAAQDTVKEARAGWPVVTGVSKAGLLDPTPILGPDGGWRVRGTAYYTGLIVQKGQSPRRPADRLLRQPLRENIGDALRRAASRMEKP